MDVFNLAWEYIKINEGGDANHANDIGGATRYGISFRFLKSLPFREGDINGDGEVDVRDIRDLTTEKAKELYRAHFWVPTNCEKINDMQIAIKICDMCVNLGVVRGIKTVQAAVNACLASNRTPLILDGICGQKTINALNSITKTTFRHYLVVFLGRVYQGLCKQNPKLKCFYDGWMRRARKWPRVIELMNITDEVLTYGTKKNR